MFSLILEAEGLAPQTLKFDQDEITIGRLSSSDLQLKGNNVSKQHSRIVYREGKYFLIDRKSTNGTFIDGKRVTAPQSLANNDRIFIGDFKITFQYEEEEPAEGAAAPSPPPIPTPLMGDSSDDVPVAGPTTVEEVPAVHETLVMQAQTEVPEDDFDEDAEDLYQELRAELYFAASEFEELQDPEEMAFYRLDEEEVADKVSEQLKALIAEILTGESPDGLADRLHDELLDELLGFGPLEQYLYDDDVDEILVNGPARIVVSHHNVKEIAPETFSCEESVYNTLARLLMPLGVEFDEETPVIDAMLPNGFAIRAMLYPYASNGTYIRVTTASGDQETLSSLEQEGCLDANMVDYLVNAISEGQTICITGENEGDRLDVMAALGAMIPDNLRPALVNLGPSVELPHDDQLVFDSTAGDVLEAEGILGTGELLRNLDRLGVDRVLLKDVREDSVVDFFYGINSGMCGAIFSVFGKEPADALKRMYWMLAPQIDGDKVVGELIGHHVDLVVSIKRFKNGQRRISSVSEVNPTDSKWELKEVFSFAVESETEEDLTGDFITG